MWIPEFAIALVIFLVCVSLFYNAYPNIKRQSEEPFLEVHTEAKVLSEMFVSRGLPENWTESNVKRPGLTNGQHKVIKEKVLNMHNLSKNNYTLLKALTGVESEFAFYFLKPDNKVVSFNGHKFFGSPDVNLTGNKINFSEEKTKNVAQVKRSLTYNKRPVRLLVTTWN